MTVYKICLNDHCTFHPCRRPSTFLKESTNSYRQVNNSIIMNKKMTIFHPHGDVFLIKIFPLVSLKIVFKNVSKNSCLKILKQAPMLLLRILKFQFTLDFCTCTKKKFDGLQLPREPRRSTRLLQLTQMAVLRDNVISIMLREMY